MSGPPLPAWSFQEAQEGAEQAAEDQATAEGDYGKAVEEAAELERDYRRALATKILELKASGLAITAAGDIARGDDEISNMRYLRDVAIGAREAAKAAMNNRHSANRRDVEALIRWSASRNREGT
jgi:hypothetical protein